jgi:hypothetical protein
MACGAPRGCATVSSKGRVCVSRHAGRMSLAVSGSITRSMTCQLVMPLPPL